MADQQAYLKSIRSTCLSHIQVADRDQSSHTRSRRFSGVSSAAVCPPGTLFTGASFTALIDTVTAEVLLNASTVVGSVSEMNLPHWR